MNVHSVSKRAPGARAVPEAPIDALVAGAEELAHRWAAALLLDRPLERYAEIAWEEFARGAPALCAQTVRAIASDSELERMVGREAQRASSALARRLPELTGARDPEALVVAVEAMRGVLWDALLDELGPAILDRSPARRIAALADRLAHVCAMALAAGLTQAPLPHPEEEKHAPSRPEAAVTDARGRPEHADVVIIDERDEAQRWRSPGDPTAPAPSAPQAPVPALPSTGGRARPWDTPLGAERPGEATPRGVDGGDAELRVRRRPRPEQSG